MKSHLKLTYTHKMTYEDWLTFRKQEGFGASEIGSLLGLSQYTSAIQLHYEKIGEGLPFKVENIAMFNGKELESYVANLWQYWAGTEQSMIENFRKKEVQRRMQRVNAYVQNPKFPWLFVSLDRKINKTATKPEGALEIKTIAGYESDKWEGGIPPAHIVQVQTQCGVCEFEFGELATMKDGRYFDVYEFDFMPDLFGTIVETSHDAWERVKKSRMILTQRFEAQKNFNMRHVEELTQELHTLEPPTDGSQGFEDFIKEKYKLGTAGEREGSIIELEAARLHKQAKAEIKKQEEIARTHENYLKNQLKDMTVLNFGGDGIISWKNNVNGARVFKNLVKI